MNAPTYLACEKNKTIEADTCQSVTIYDIINWYPTGYRGGTHDSDGRSIDRRGGSTEAENASRYHQEAAERGAHTRLQVRGGMARQTSRSREVYRGSEVHQEEELISVSSVTAHSVPIDWTRFGTECCTLSLHAHFSRFVCQLSTCCQVGYEVAVREDNHYD